jgi:hypothetical protein
MSENKIETASKAVEKLEIYEKVYSSISTLLEYKNVKVVIWDNHESREFRLESDIENEVLTRVLYLLLSKGAKEGLEHVKERLALVDEALNQ